MGEVFTFPKTAAGFMARFPAEAPMSNVGAHGFPAPDRLDREPTPDFEVDRRRGCVIWRANGLRLVHAEQFRVLADIFAENGWVRHFNALNDAELAASEPEGAA